jgi:putative acyl-CoA dehydrogenase
MLAQELEGGTGQPIFERYREALLQRLKTETAHEASARRLTQDLILGVQASLLLRHAPSYVAEAFCQSRLAHDWGYTFGTLGPRVNFREILERAWPTRR